MSLLFERFVAMFGNFNDFTTQDSGGRGSGTAQRSNARSRSPMRSQMSQARTSLPASFREPWTCEHPGLDEYVKQNDFEPQTLEKMTLVDVSQRRKWVQDIMSKKIDNPNAWIGRCFSNWTTDRKLEELTGVNRYGEKVKARRGSSGGSPVGQCHAIHSGGSDSGYGASCVNIVPLGGGRPRQYSRSCATGEAPALAKEVFDLWPNEKSRMVKEVCKRLNSEAQDVVMGLDPPSAAAACFIICLAAPASEEGTSAIIKEWGQRRAAFIAKSPGPSAGLSQVSCDTKEMEIMVVIIGIDDGRAAVLAHAAAKIMQSMHNDKIRFDKPVIIAPTAGRDIKQLQEQCGLTPSNHDITTMPELETYIERMSNEWTTRQTKFLLINMLPPTKEFHKTQTGTDTSNGLHMSETRWIFEAGKVAHLLCGAVGQENVSTILFSPMRLNGETKNTLKTMFGVPMENVTQCLNTVSNTPLIFTTPSGAVYQTVVEETPKMLEHDGWKMLPKVYDWATKNHSLGSQAVSLLHKKLFGERAWDAEETQLMEALLAKHVQSGEERYMSREWWMQQYGILGQTPLPSFFMSKLPCHGLIFAMTGVAGKGQNAVPCGKVRYCENCEKIIHQLDQGYHFHVLTNAVINILTKAVSTWKRGGDPTAFARPDDWDRQHQCGLACPYNPLQQ